LGRRGEGDLVDHVLCYRSAYNNDDIQFAYCQGVNACVAVLGSANTKEARVVYEDGAIAKLGSNPNCGIPLYLRIAFADALAGGAAG
jgi:hypothetical protein